MTPGLHVLESARACRKDSGSDIEHAQGFREWAFRKKKGSSG